MIQKLMIRAVEARLAAAENPKASVSIQDGASRDALDVANMLHRHEREDETEAMRKRRREEEDSAKREKAQKRITDVQNQMEEQGRPRLTGIPKLLATQRQQLVDFPPDSLDVYNIPRGLFQFPRPISAEHPDQTIYKTICEGFGGRDCISIEAGLPEEIVDLKTMQEFADKPNGGFRKLSDYCVHCRFVKKHIRGGGDQALLKYSTSRNQMYVLTREQLTAILARQAAREAENAEAELAEHEAEEE